MCFTHHLLPLPSLYFAFRLFLFIFFFHFRGIRSSFRDIFLREGIQGLFAGITPRLIGEVLVVVISGPLATAINRSNQFVEPRWIRRFASFSFRVKFSFNSVVSF